MTDLLHILCRIFVRASSASQIITGSTGFSLTKFLYFIQANRTVIKDKTCVGIIFVILYYSKQCSEMITLRV